MLTQVSLTLIHPALATLSNPVIEEEFGVHARQLHSPSEAALTASVDDDLEEEDEDEPEEEEDDLDDEEEDEDEYEEDDDEDDEDDIVIEDDDPEDEIEDEDEDEDDIEEDDPDSVKKLMTDGNPRMVQRFQAVPRQ